MGNTVENFKKTITEVFSICVDVLHVSRSLKTISQDLKLLALNGIVQAAKIGSSQGQSLITLSGFLSTLPTQIAPELEELVNIAGKLSREITLCSIAVRKMINYVDSLSFMINYIAKTTNQTAVISQSNIYSLKFLNNIENTDLIKYSDEMMKNNFKNIIQKDLAVISRINAYLLDSQGFIMTSRQKIEKIRRNGFIANYMGSNISIETSYLPKNQQNFNGLVQNIKAIVDSLNSKLDVLQTHLIESEKLLDNLIKFGILK